MDPKRAVEIPTMDGEFSDLNACFLNVHRQVKAHGGKMRFGWLAGKTIFEEHPCIQIWVHHCVWESPEEKLFDLTPQLDSIFAVLPPTTIFVPDDEATLLTTSGGLLQSRNPHYTVLTEGDKVRRAVECLKAADDKLSAGDLKGESYWSKRAGDLLGGWIQPYGEFGLKIMQPFSLD